MKRIAIIDLGTNTFNLLIAEVNPDKTYRSLFQTKISVKLGEGGINRGVIELLPFQRGIDALKIYDEIARKYNVEKIFAFGTSAIRGASNGNLFIDQVKKETGIEVQIISGEREARLIYYGVREAVIMSEEPSLIMDIGGGSTEFIIANKNNIFWKQSFLLGVARLIEKFNHSDPISSAQIQTLNDHLQQELKPLAEAIEKYPIMELIGSSGSFDSLAEMIACKFYSPSILDNKTEYTFDLNEYKHIHETILKSTKPERLQMQGLIEMRVDMIVVASIMIKFILSSLQIKKMRLSTYSLKEGALYEMLNDQL